MAHFFTADVHLRLDHPERARRFASWVDGLEPSDKLYVVGDLCDFWFASRQSRWEKSTCPGLNALSRFSERGGNLTVLAGNHDGWLGPFYEKRLGATFLPDTCDLTLDGLRIQLVHGHRLGGVGRMKKIMESKAFLRTFGALPGPVARLCERRLDKSNATFRTRDDQRQGTKFQHYVASLNESKDLVVIGHLHQTIDTQVGSTRMIVPGSWHAAACYVEIRDGQVLLVAGG